MLSVLAVGMDPFAQQLLQYRQSVPHFVETDRVTIARAQRYSKGTESRTQVVMLRCKWIVDRCFVPHMSDSSL